MTDERASEKNNNNFDIKYGVQYDSYVKGISPGAVRVGDTLTELEERIRNALFLKEVSLKGTPLDVAALMAEIAEKHLCRFPLSLHTVQSTNRSGGSYGPHSSARVGAKISIIAVFIHEVAHAIQYAIYDYDEAHEIFAKKLRSIRKDNIEHLKNLFCRAAEYVPCLSSRLNHLLKGTISERGNNWIDRMKEHANSIPVAILEEFSKNLVSRYALRTSMEYFCESMTDYLLNPEPSIFSQRVWQLAESMALDVYPTSRSATTWLDGTEFSCRQGEIGDTRCDTILWVCDEKWNFRLPGIDNYKKHLDLHNHVQANIPATECESKSHMFTIPSELDLPFRRIVLIMSYNRTFYYDAMKAAGKYGVENLAIPLFFDRHTNNFKMLEVALKMYNLLVHASTRQLRKITFITPNRVMALGLKKYLPIAVEGIAPDNDSLTGPVRLSQVEFNFKRAFEAQASVHQQPKMPHFAGGLTGVDVVVRAGQVLTAEADAAIIFTSQFSNLFSKQISNQQEHLSQSQTLNKSNTPALLKLENIVEQEKLHLYRAAPGKIRVLDVPPELELGLRHIILVPRSLKLRADLFLAAVRKADELKVSSLAIPYYLHAHAEKVAFDLVDDLKLADQEFGGKPDVLRRITFCAQSGKDIYPSLLK